MAGPTTNLHKISLQVSLHPACAQGQGRGRGQSSCDTSTFGISQESLLLSGKWLSPDWTLSFPNLSFPLFVQFSSASTSQSRNGCKFELWVPPKLTWWNSLSNCLLYSTVSRSVYVRSLNEAPLHCPSRPSISQLDLMSKSWNELLCHWSIPTYMITTLQCQTNRQMTCHGSTTLVTIPYYHWLNIHHYKHHIPVKFQ